MVSIHCTFGQPDQNPISDFQCQEGNYRILNDPKRKASFSADKMRCDSESGNDMSLDWRGPNWYRVMPPAGDKLADHFVEAKNCNTLKTGWISSGTHPSTPGDVNNATVCFSYIDGSQCKWEKEIQIKNCGGEYYLYFLPEVPLCSARYCTL